MAKRGRPRRVAGCQEAKSPRPDGSKFALEVHPVLPRSDCVGGFGADSSDGSELGTGGSQYILCVPEMLDETADSNGPETGEEV